MIHKMTRMSGRGDQLVREWDTDTVTEQDLQEIEREFTAKQKEGYFAADLSARTR